MLSPAVFPWKDTGYPTQLVTIEQTSLVGSGIDNLCLLSYTS